VPAQLVQLLESKEGTRRTVIKSGITEHETTLPFSNRGARCHDLALRAERDGCAVTICVEAKADESFGGSVDDEGQTKRTPVKTGSSPVSCASLMGYVRPRHFP
jgi:hypothetical protein